MLKNFKIGTQIGLGFFLVLAVSALMVAFAIHWLQSSGASFKAYRELALDTELDPEQRDYLNKAGSMLGDEGFVQLVEASRSHSLAEHLTKCIDDFRRWTDAIPIADDISVLALELPES